MQPDLEPPVTQYSPLFELRAWRREVGRLQLKYDGNEAVLAIIAQLRRDADAWIEANEQR